MAETVHARSAFGGQTMIESLRRVLVRRPPVDTNDWKRFGWRAKPDAVGLAREHERFRSLLEDAGAEVVVSPATTLDAIYAFDPALVGDTGAVLLRPGKPERADEVAVIASELECAGVPVAARLEPPALAEGGDTAWLDERTLLVGRGYRTNQAGIDALEEALGVETIAFDLPHFHGPAEVMHLLSLFSPLDRDLVVAYPPLMPVALVQLFADRGVEIVPVPDEEFPTMGANVLALAPRRALALERNVETRRRLERAGVDVSVYRGEELSKGDGGPTCLTRPLLRAPARA
jgi:N-dimethylarginine dimethylaminohydrolase